MNGEKLEEGLGLVRFILVWSSLSPVFLLWAVRGVDAIGDRIWIPVCLALFVLPTFLLCIFLKISRYYHNLKTITVVTSKDQREHLLTYLFAMLIPLFDANLDERRDIASIFIAFIFVAFLFWHMRLHYMNLIFAIAGYRIYTVEVKLSAGSGVADQLATYAVISRRHYLPEQSPLSGYRLGGNVLVDEKNDD
ncbi:hypothetical protein [Rhizobium lentis]|uniref:hypothetical protein n=1 Tax=Rhizobium lentis TaxID=1138194 RepID=UPI001C838312|nr:hypothetical protein [Rhizobium lentis]MBX5030191.1 hypothetical protein [Rhizobium lentis]MBX5035716.1 hypothetical protein [Rhizobium lentis]